MLLSKNTVILSDMTQLTFLASRALNHVILSWCVKLKVKLNFDFYLSNVSGFHTQIKKTGNEANTTNS